MAKSKHVSVIENRYFIVAVAVVTRVTRKKLPNVYKSSPKMISLEKWYILTPFQKLPNNVGDLGKLIVAKGFETVA